uniref:hypothetical protein n=1 Tax=Vibrio cholerae TaxID=666 RepID=UPI003F585FFF
MEFFNFLMNDVLSEPAVLVGLIALIGLIAQKNLSPNALKARSKPFWVLSFLELVLALW